MYAHTPPPTHQVLPNDYARVLAERAALSALGGGASAGKAQTA